MSEDSDEVQVKQGKAITVEEAHKSEEEIIEEQSEQDSPI